MKKPIKKALVKTIAALGQAKANVSCTLFSSPEQLVASMKRSNYYPCGKAYWQIAPKIVKSTKIEPEAKMELLLDMYGKYYIYQHERAINFAVYENYYEKFMFYGYDGRLHKDIPKYEKLFNELAAEQTYIINRNIRDEARQILTQIKHKQGDISPYLDSLEPKTGTIVGTAAILPDDFHSRLVFNVYCPTREEDNITTLLTERYKDRHPEEFRENITNYPFPEFAPRAAALKKEPIKEQ